MQARLDLSRAEGAGPQPPPAAQGRGAEDPLAALRLARSRNVGPATWLRLLRRFGTASRALEALPDLAYRGGAGGRGQAVMSPAPLAQAEREMEAGLAAGARLLIWGQPDYPSSLAQIPDPPPILWLRGDAGALSRPSVAVVGARNASALGLRMARLLGRDLSAAGIPVVSGLARGVDGAAHEAALQAMEGGADAAGGTVAALAGCLAKVYPPEHQALADRIAESGALVSEAPIGLEPQARHFPRRNRIIAGLSRAVVLVEAASRSGSLITADFALEQGREVMAVPGAPLDPRSDGGNALIRQGAALIRHADDVIEELQAVAARRIGADPAAAHAPPSDPPGLAEDPPAPLRPRPWASDSAEMARLRRQVSDLLGLAPVEEDELLRLAQAPLTALADVLLELELAGRLDRRPGGYLALLPE